MSPDGFGLTGLACLLLVGHAHGRNQRVVGLCLVGLVLGFEFSLEGGDVEDGFVFGFLEASMAAGFNSFDFSLGDILGLLKAAVAVVADGCQISVELA